MQSAKSIQPSPPPREIALQANPHTILRSILIFWIACEASLYCLDVTFAYFKIVDARPIQRLFNMTREDGLASLMGILQTFLVTATATLIWKLSPAQNGRKGWALTAGIFLYLTLDDGSKFHERLGTSVRLLNENNPEGWVHQALNLFPSYSWQVLFLPFLAVMGLVMLRHLWLAFSCLPRLRISLVGAFTCYGVAIVLDYFEGIDGFHMGTSEYTWRHFSKITEEGLEMFGTTLFLYTFVSFLMKAFPQFTLRFQSKNSGTTA